MKHSEELPVNSEHVQEGNRKKEFDYLCTDDFIQDMLHARALATAFEIGLIDFLIERKSATLESTARRFGTDERSLHLLVGFLRSNHVIEDWEGKIGLTESFTHSLRFRDLLELKLQITRFAAHDLLDRFNDLICRPNKFVQGAKFFRLFSCENYELTRRWVRITTTLTKYEAQVCMKYHDFGPYQRMLDIGGNSGEFALRICKKYPGIHATVFDLPVVCDVGLEHIRPEPEADRITFIKGDALKDELPKGFDLISFKSMLHDWPEAEAKQFIRRASHALEPGGTLLIFERGPLEAGVSTLPYSIIPHLIFFHSFRSPAIYEEQMKDLSFQDIKRKKIDLETPFYLITARKPLDHP